MAKTKPIITHTEIYVRAIRSIEDELDEWRLVCDVYPQEEREKMYNIATEELRCKLDTLKTMYRYETGVDYN